MEPIFTFLESDAGLFVIGVALLIFLLVSVK